ncbi:MAG: DUF4301 domain-containing protein [Bacteroidetes bacterium]|nr:MAG: DUF4301 domain-containing protein [Bacteroidota bacterium]
MNFTEKDIKQIEKKGLTVEKVNAQIQLFKTGFPFVNLKGRATIGNGILKLNKKEKEEYIAYFNNKRDTTSMLKFVPASGAATRMFKFLFSFIEEYDSDNESINSYINRKKATELSIFLIGLKYFPFYYKVKQQLYKDCKNFDSLSNNKQIVLFVKMMLEKDKLNYGDFPKGLLPFHQYRTHFATAFEEHLFEAAYYASSNNKANLHFTISEKHNHKFDDEFKRIEEIVEKKTKTSFDISFSYQKGSTDTIAVTPKNIPFREEDGSLLFRPSGHGALLENLNDLNADIIFVKNIDNVAVFNFEEEVGQYKKILAGILLKIQKQAFQYQKDLDNKAVNDEDLINIAQFLSNKMNITISSEFEKYSIKYQIEYLAEKLNRPIRVCGMVKNEGEPGGGPFWVKEESGNFTLQIVESAQIDKKNKLQKDILKNATHFNPVDLVCGIKNYKGKKFNLTKFVDYKTAFITMKTKTGKDIKALELPGLWNGSMAHWNSIFVEVPLITFNPVKTVNDLMKPQHQIN